MELTFSTIAMLVSVLIVLLVVLVFFRGSIEDVGAKFGFISQSAGESVDDETKSGGSLDVGGVISRIKSSMCTVNSDCANGNCVDTWLCVKPGCAKDGDWWSTEGNCKAGDACGSCASGWECRGPSDRCWPR